MFHHPGIKVFTTEMGVTRGRFHLKDAVINIQYRNIKGAATEVKDKNILLSTLGVLLIQTIGQRCGGGLINNPKSIQARDRKASWSNLRSLK